MGPKFDSYDAVLAMRLIETICMNAEQNQYIDDIYMITHCFSCTCKNGHKDWKEELEILIKNLAFKKI